MLQRGNVCIINTIWYAYRVIPGTDSSIHNLIGKECVVLNNTQLTPFVNMINVRTFDLNIEISIPESNLTKIIDGGEHWIDTPIPFDEDNELVQSETQPVDERNVQLVNNWNARMEYGWPSYI
jgi:hypothetical protein